MLKKEIEIEKASLTDIDLSQEKIEEKILSEFKELKDIDKFNYYFTEYNFQKEEENKIDLWNKIFKYLLGNIFFTFGMKISELKKYCTIHKKIPNLTNIIKELRIRNILILDSDILNEEYYKKNFPELNSENNSSSQNLGSYLLSGVKNIINFGAAKLGYNSVPEKRKDISDKDKYNKLSDDEIVFNYDLFKKNTNDLLIFIDSKLKKGNLLLEKSDLFCGIEYELLKDKNTGNIEYYDYCLIYLIYTKKIISHIIKKNNNEREFLRLMRDKSDSLKENDKIYAKLLYDKLELYDKRLQIENYIEDFHKIAKLNLQNNDRENAKKILSYKIKCKKILEKIDKKLEIISTNISDIYLYETNKEYKKWVDKNNSFNDKNLDELKDLMSLDDLIKLLDETQIEENKEEDKEEDKVMDEVKSLEEFLK